MKKENKALIIQIISTFIILIIFGILWKNGSIDRLRDYVNHTTLFLVIMTFLSIVFYCSKCSLKNFVYSTMLIVVIAIIIILGDYQYSPIDEAAHIDYINYISQNNELPTMYTDADNEFLFNINQSKDLVNCRRYEAVQVPLYYVLMSCLTRFIPSLYVQFIFARFFGLVCFILTLFIAKKALDLLRKHKIIRPNNNYSLLLLLIIFNAGIMYRFIHASNECLAVVFADLVIYFAIKLLLEDFNYKDWIIGFICALGLFYTKSTGALLIVAILFVLLYQKKILLFFTTGIMYSIMAIPWFYRNIKLYGTLSGMNIHEEIVLPITNPNRKSVDLIHFAFELFNNSYFISEESFTRDNNLVVGLCYFFNVMIWLILILAVFYVFRFIVHIVKNKLEYTYSIFEKRNVILTMSVALVFLQIILLAYSAYTSKLTTLISRYMYLVSIPLLLIIILMLDKITIKKYFQGVLSVYSACTYLIVIEYSINEIYQLVLG